MKELIKKIQNNNLQEKSESENCKYKYNLSKNYIICDFSHRAIKTQDCLGKNKCYYRGNISKNA